MHVVLTRKISSTLKRGHRVLSKKIENISWGILRRAVYQTMSPTSPSTFSFFSMVGFLLLAGVLVLVLWLNVSREHVKDEAVRANLQSIVTQAYIVRSYMGTYGMTKGYDCEEGLFRDPTIQSALIAVRVANGYKEEYCVSTPDTFSVIVSRPSRGFYVPDSLYWCADNTGSVCARGDASRVDRSCGCE